MFKCQYCERTFKNKGGLTKHTKSCQHNPNRVDGYAWNKGKPGSQIAWNKGLKTGKGGRCKDPHKEQLRRKKISDGMQGRGGYRQGSGRGKKGWYKGIFCDSSWELAYVLYNMDHSIPFERNTKQFEYIFEGKPRKYIPDFVQDGKYIEVKGYKTSQWKAKLEQFPEPITVLYEQEIQSYIDYAVNTYGKEYIALYE